MLYFAPAAAAPAATGTARTARLRTAILRTGTLPRAIANSASHGVAGDDIGDGKDGKGQAWTGRGEASGGRHPGATLRQDPLGAVDRLLEDYVELIADLLQDAGEARPTDIARRLGVSHATAIKTIARLKRAGLATARPYRGVFLTEKGEAMAERVRIRHRLVVDVLCALGVPTESAEADAEGIEHHVSETTLKAFAHFLKSRR